MQDRQQIEGRYISSDVPIEQYFAARISKRGKFGIGLVAVTALPMSLLSERKENSANIQPARSDTMPDSAPAFESGADHNEYMNADSGE